MWVADRFNLTSAGSPASDFFMAVFPTVFLFSLGVFVSSLCCYFLNPKVFDTWHKFAKWYLGIFCTLTILAGFSSTTGGFGPNIGGGVESQTIFLAVLFLLISVGIIIYKHSMTKNQK